MSDPGVPVTRRTAQHLEDEAARYLIDVLRPRIEDLRARWDAPPGVVIAGSSLAADDRWSRPFHISHAAWHAVGHAIDDVDAVRELVIRGEAPHFEIITHPHSLYPLIRAAMENASAAVWLLGSNNRDERLIRRFRLVLSDAFYQDDVIRMSGRGQGDTLNKRRERVRALVDRRGRGLTMSRCAKRVSFSEMIRGAGEWTGFSADRAEAIWRTLSGLTHGDMWASVAMLDREQIAVSEDEDVVTIRPTSSLTNVANSTSVAVSLTRAAIALYDRQRQPQR